MIKKRMKWIVCLAAPLILLAIPFGYGINFGQFFQKVILKPQKTGIMTLHFYDKSRDRPLTTEVWYPVESHVPSCAASGVWMRCDEARDAPLSGKQERYPLIVLSHGNGCDRYNISWLAEALAANGYIVAAMDHFGNTWNNKIPECYVRPWERPKDVSFVVDQLLESSLFKEKIDAKRIGFAGYSLGGATGIWVAGASPNLSEVDRLKKVCTQELAGVVSQEVIEQVDFKEACCSFYDERISALFLLAPALGSLFDPPALEKIDIPVYIIAPERDEIVPFASNAKIFAEKIQGASLLVLQGEVTHFTFLNPPTTIGRRFLDAKYWGDPKSIDRQKIHQDLSKQALEFFSKRLNSR
jgi:predicted dienelactone hydrolase